MKKRIVILPIIFLPIFLLAQNRIYVNQNAQGNNTGTSWENAYINLNTALQNAQVQDTIWIAKGTYYPATNNNRDASFTISTGLHLYGGFNGTEAQLADRNLATNLTTLSGDIGELDNDEDNSYTVARIESLATSVSLNDLTIEKGNANNDNPNSSATRAKKNGGGLFVDTESKDDLGELVLNNCEFRNNEAAARSGAIYLNDFQKISVKNCFFSNNFAPVGGVITFFDNSNRTGQSFEINSSFFTNNSAEIGSCIHSTTANTGVDIKILSSKFERNEALIAGVGRFDIFASKSKIGIANCDFIKNIGTNLAGALYFLSDEKSIDIEISDCNFIDQNTNTNLTDYNLQGVGGAIFMEGSSQDSINGTLSFTRTNFIGNKAKSGGAIDHKGYDLEIENCLFARNYALHEGGAISVQVSTRIINIGIINSTFFSNRSDRTGGAIRSSNTSGRLTDQTIQIRNSIFNQNKAVQGNIITGYAPRYYLYDTMFDVDNCDEIVCSNHECDNLPNCENLLFNTSALFKDTLNNDFTLSPCSPAVNAGNNDFVSEIQTDLQGNTRIQDGQVDIGAYEAPPMTVEIALSRNSCSGANNGQVFFRIENACPLYEVTWTRGEISGNGTENLAAGDYQFTITDSRGRSEEQQGVVIVETPALEAHFNVQNASATNVLDGAVVVEEISGGTAPYQVLVYDLENELFRSQDNLQVGNYQLIIKDANGCEQIYDFVIDALSNTTALDNDLLVQISPNPVCSDRNATLTIKNPNHPPYTITLFDSQGKLLQKQIITLQNNIELVLPEMLIGLYFVRVMTADGKSKTLKVVRL
ncbi:MAG: choice-of-anchor Q domain-containing protein [Bacteroidota bacterium]